MTNISLENQISEIAGLNKMLTAHVQITAEIVDEETLEAVIKSLLSLKAYRREENRRFDERYGY